MDAENIYKAIQVLARDLMAVRMPIERIVELATRNIDLGSVKPCDIVQHLRKEESQKTLALDYETALQRHVSGQFILVCLALPSSPAAAKVLVNRRIKNSRESCCFDLLNEGSYAILMLEEAKDPTGRRIANELVHKGPCSLAWTRLKQIAERGE